MPLSAGTKLGPYEILAPIGAGGMGEVYKARDTKLEREVAIKVLPHLLAQDPERLARFEREAKVLASLNHPNIAQIYAVEEFGGIRALVMELVPGQTLKGPIPLDETLRLAARIADALGAAHEKGITHRDLKPANVMITPEGVIKILDFGLAAVSEPSGTREGDPSQSPTLTLSPTRAGMILGTAAYMSPEQARGQSVDRRSDIWAFGVLMYEMLTDQQLFHGGTVSDILASVLKEEPNLEQIPAKVRPLLMRCLEKEPKKRLQAIGDWGLLLPDAPVASTPASSRTTSQLGGVAWGVAGLAAICALGVSFVHFRETPPADPPLHLSVPLPANLPAAFLALSPDGRRLVVSLATEGKSQLWLRPLDSPQLQALSGTDVPRAPFWSPDGKSIGFFADGKLKTIPATGGPPQVLCDGTGLGSGGTWNRDGVILFGTQGVGAPLRRVNGLKEELLLEIGSAKAPSDWSRDGRYLIYTETDTKSSGDIWFLPDPLDKSGDRKPVKFQGTDAIESQGQLSPDGRWLAYVSEESGESEVYVRPFPSGAGRWKVSVGGGYIREPRWRRDGKELFFLDALPPRNRLMAVPVQSVPRGGFQAGTPQALFEFRAIGTVLMQNHFLYSPAADGQRFLVSVQAGDAEPMLNVITNWEKAALASR